MILYEPTDTVKPIADGLYLVDGPVVRMAAGPFNVPFPSRMAIARLDDGGLWVWSPTALSPALKREVDALGPVRHLVSPNRIHYANIPAWEAAYPDAVAWASPGVRERAASQHIEVRFDRDLSGDPPAEWASSIDQLIFRGSSAMEEVVFFHRASRTLILADLIENFERDKLSLPMRWMARIGGVLDPDGKTPSDWRITFRGDGRARAKASLARMLALAPERVVIAHGRWYPDEAPAEIGRAFRWLS